MFNKLIKTIVVCIGINTINAQDTLPRVKNPPVIVEGTFNNNGLLFQTIVQKKFLSAPKFGVLAVSEILGKWNRKEQDGYMIQANLTYEFVKGFSLMGGFHTASGIGMRPALGIIYTYAKSDFFIMFNPRCYIDKSANLEGFLISEYKPKISENWRFYARLQGVYCLTAAGGVHNISYARARAGFAYKEFAFGLGGSVEFYGPQAMNENNFGVFINAALF